MLNSTTMLSDYRQPSGRGSGAIEDTLQLLADFVSRDLLSEKWLLAKRRRAANLWKHRLALSGVAVVNVHGMTLETGVRRLLDVELRLRDAQFADSSIAEFLLQGVLRNLWSAGRLRYFSQVENLGALRSVIGRTIFDLRLAGVVPEGLDAKQFDSPARGHDLKLLLSDYQSALNKHNLMDYAACLKLLIERSEPRKNLVAPPAIVVVDRDIAEHWLEKQVFEVWRAAGRIHDCCGEEAVDGPLSDGLSEPASLRILASEGEVNEIQGALRLLLHSDSPTRLDQVELLYSRYETYVPLIHNFFLSLDEAESSVEQLPVTFAEGIGCIYSRPGRGLRAWLRWLASDCPQSHLVQMIREGLVDLPCDDVGHGFARAASTLRRLPIGLGRERHREQLRRAVETAQTQLATEASRDDDEEVVHHRRGGDFGLAILKLLDEWIGSLLDISPQPMDAVDQVLANAEVFVREFARATSKFDKLAAAQLLDQIANMRRMLGFAPELQFDVWAWLEELPVVTRVMSSGPQPGCLHVDSVNAGGLTGRPHLMVVGLDDSRLGPHQFQDPLLLDDERQSISLELQTSDARREHEAKVFRGLFAVRHEAITLAYSTKSLIEDRKLFPSSLFLEVYRSLRNRETASEQDVLAEAVAVGFLDEPQHLLSVAQQRSASLLLVDTVEERLCSLEAWQPHWSDGRRWKEAVTDVDRVTEEDGIVPKAGELLDPSADEAPRVSASGLETYGACPRRFFFRRGLRIQPPDELVLEDDRWLDPLTYGSMIHSVFEQFLIRLTEQDRLPEFSRDLPTLTTILNEHVTAAEEATPVRHSSAKHRQVQDLLKTCEVFLREEEKYCSANRARPFVMEASIGLGDDKGDGISCSEPVRLTLADGSSFLASGILDRVDRLGDQDASHFAIWDYKSGSDWAYKQEDAFQNGRKLQPFLYASLLKHRLLDLKAGDQAPPGEVRQFGYFFPGPRTNGRRIQWSTGELRQGDVVLSDLFQSIRSGCFVATTDKDDCKFCDYVEICGDPQETERATRSKLRTSTDDRVAAYRKLRAIEGEQQ